MENKEKELLEQIKSKSLDFVKNGDSTFKIQIEGLAMDCNWLIFEKDEEVIGESPQRQYSALVPLDKFCDLCEIYYNQKSLDVINVSLKHMYKFK